MLSSRFRACSVACASSFALRLHSTAQTCAATPCGSSGHVHGPQCLVSHSMTAVQQQPGTMNNASPSRPLYTSAASAAARAPTCGSPGHVHGPHCAHMPRTLHPGYRDYHAKGSGGNRGVVYVGPGKVEVASIADAQLVEPSGRKANHGVIIKTLATNICGSDQHMVPLPLSPSRC